MKEKYHDLMDQVKEVKGLKEFYQTNNSDCVKYIFYDGRILGMKEMCSLI